MAVMNWTGGRLQRHSYKKQQSFKTAQKQYFAKARLKSQRRQRQVPSSSTSNSSVRPGLIRPLAGTQQRRPGRDIDSELKDRRTSTHRVNKPHRDLDKEASRTNRSSSPHFHQFDHRQLHTSHEAGFQNSNVCPPVEFPRGETDPQISKAQNFEHLRRQLLNRKDWATLSLARPLRMGSFTNNGNDNENVARRRVQLHGTTNLEIRHQDDADSDEEVAVGTMIDLQRGEHEDLDSLYQIRGLYSSYEGNDIPEGPPRPVDGGSDYLDRQRSSLPVGQPPNCYHSSHNEERLPSEDPTESMLLDEEESIPIPLGTSTIDGLPGRPQVLRRNGQRSPAHLDNRVEVPMTATPASSDDSNGPSTNQSPSLVARGMISGDVKSSQAATVNDSIPARLLGPRHSLQLPDQLEPGYTRAEMVYDIENLPPVDENDLLVGQLTYDGCGNSDSLTNVSVVEERIQANLEEHQDDQTVQTEPSVAANTGHKGRFAIRPANLEGKNATEPDHAANTQASNGEDNLWRQFILGHPTDGDIVERNGHDALPSPPRMEGTEITTAHVSEYPNSFSEPDTTEDESPGPFPSRAESIEMNRTESSGSGNNQTESDGSSRTPSTGDFESENDNNSNVGEGPSESRGTQTVRDNFTWHNQPPVLDDAEVDAFLPHFLEPDGPPGPEQIKRMRLLLSAPLFSALLPHLTSALPRVNRVEKGPLPLVIWHGLGDDYGADGLKHVAQLAETVNPGTYVHIVRVGETRTADREASFFGNVTTQLDQVCQQLATEQILSTAPAVNAIGFSQGGQFLRGYIERCNFPPVRNLVTFGSQHNGISSFQACSATGDWLCKGAEALLRFGRWSGFVQSRLVPAQYFRDPLELDSYLEYSNFLADINNEREVKNETYKENLAKLNKFAMYMFEDDQTVVPKESAHFAEVNSTTGEVTKLKDRTLYKEDWLGLKKLNKAGKLDFQTIPGAHMQFSDETLKTVLEKYFGPIDLPDVADTVLVVQDGN
ncbi:hypothetical protein FQN53_004599 [Emmonsiellopsis sp. PD_33]|nr:hypothetical protein FQN53_004599 [Emmonsiellopsis sp. PD_33]